MPLSPEARRAYGLAEGDHGDTTGGIISPNIFGGGGPQYPPIPGSVVTPPPPPNLPFNFTNRTQRNPDIGQAQSDIRAFRGQISPEQRARDAMAGARELGVGMTAEARANEAKRGVSGSGVSAYNDRNIAGKVMSEALQAGEKAKYGGEQLVMDNLGLGLNAAQAQAGDQQAGNALAMQAQMAQYQAQSQAKMEQYRAQLAQQQALAAQVASLSNLGGTGLSGIPATGGQPRFSAGSTGAGSTFG